MRVPVCFPAGMVAGFWLPVTAYREVLALRRRVLGHISEKLSTMSETAGGRNPAARLWAASTRRPPLR
jgi:hypothetical protein